MAGLWESHYWLFTGRDWEQDRENFACNSGFCDHDHVTRDSLTTTGKEMGNWTRAVLIGALLLIVSAVPIMLFCEWKGWLD